MGRIKQNLKERIQFKDLEYLEIVGSPEVLDLLYKYLMRIAPILGLDYEGLMNFIGLKLNDYSPEFLENAQKYELKEDDKFSKKEIESFEKFFTDKKTRNQNLLKLPLNLAKVWFIYGKDEKNKPTFILTDMYKILEEATGTDIKLLRNTDYLILAEIFVRIILKPRNAFQNGFFLKTILEILDQFIPIFSYMMSELLKKLIKKKKS